MMKNIRFLLMMMLSVAVVYSCSDDEDPPVFDAPTIAVTSDNSSPFPTDVVTFTINVTATGGLSEVTLDGTVIKSYSNNEESDQFTHEVTIAEDATLGPTDFNFAVSDAQTTVKNGDFSLSITVRNPDLRGNPVLLYDFQSAVPNSSVEEITRDIGDASWKNAYEIFLDAADPVNPANQVLQADRKGAHEWEFQSGGAVFINFADFIDEDDIQGLVDGTRVLQMNFYFQEVPKIVSAHKSPADTESTRNDDVNVSWTFDLVDDAIDEDYKNVWSFDTQDSSQYGIPLAIELGNNAAWAWNGGDVTGKKLYLVGSITKANDWQTVTFSRRGGNIIRNAGDDGWEYNNFVPLTQASSDQAALQDTNIGLDEIDYMAIIMQNRFTSFENPDGWFQFPSNGNQWQSDVPWSIVDDHNSYFIDNIRIIDAVEYDKNPND